ncbi:TonB-linked outer membrane protein, SusC/RagA family [Filimonas lacunae]|uniref:TonB-linked outer membrane protein, SusC/RagA family n=1 Tax=Filimonas lacunae TaxID=477680 RepID=A0A173MCT8_9BACT|nr:SusC/RagA family TonB-linked outer membrane protein [Filimonas lacunae]BAV05393.1 outer membrane protein, nutrient binding [Filimonas lacunae]SIT21481.1 TonB-linked outer membrane protein, SusC/RagA family [Filimonas lacunae]
MRITAILLLVASLHVCAKGITQKVSFTGKDVSVEQVFAAIEKQTGYVVFFDYASLGQVKKVSVAVKDVSITELLRACFKDDRLEYTIQGKTILISRKEKSAAVIEEYTPPPPTDIKGVVYDSAGNPLVGATVMIKGAKAAVQSDARGAFILRNASEDVLLVVSFTGYETKVVSPWKDRGREMIVILKSSTNPLDETIVQAYGTTTKRFNVGSISKVSKEDIQSQPVFNPLSALEGRVPGLLVTTQSGLSGSAVKLQIRGQNTVGSTPGSKPLDNPFIIIDGVPFAPQNNSFNFLQNAADANSVPGLSPLANINPADIESIEVLKDADATAIYGARGANGVILITTRKAAAGKPSLTGNIATGFSRLSRTMPLMNTAQYLQMRKQAFINDNQTPGLNVGSNYAPDLLVFDSAKNTDFLHDLYGETAGSLNASLFLSGGSSSNTFSMGVGYGREGTNFPGSFINDRMSFNATIHHQSTDRRFTVDLTSGYSYNRNNLPGGPGISSAFTLPPNFPDLLNADGSLAWVFKGITSNNISTSFQNPYAYLYQTANVGSQNLLLNLTLNYRILSGLTFKTALGYSLFTGTEYRKFPLMSQSPYAFGRDAVASKNNSSSYTWNIEPQLNYNRKIGNGKLDVLAGMTFQKMTSNRTTLVGTGFINDLLLNSIKSAGVITLDEAYNPYKYSAAFGRINYVYNTRYIVNLTGRMDGSSRFIKNRRNAKFGAVGAGWIFSEEAFVKKALPVLSFGKLRGSFGITGDDNVNNYQYYSNWKIISANNIYNGSLGYAPQNPDNPDYSWSTTKKLEAGLDAGLWGDKILLGITWYRNRTSDQLVQYKLPSQTGFTTVTTNFQAVIQNSGWEFTVGASPVKNKNFNWKTALNVTVPSNKLVAFPGLAASNYANMYVLGKSTSTIQGYSYAGINDTTGLYQFNTKGGSKTSSPSALNGDNRFILGNLDTRYFGGFRNTFTYKKFQVDMFLEFRKQMGPNFIYSLGYTPGTMVNMPVEVMNNWTKQGDKATYQKFSQLAFGASVTANTTQTYAKLSDFAYSDASYIRFKTLGISYSLDGGFLKKVKMSSCRVYVNAQNLFVITGYKGHDPETQNYYGIPPLKSISTGLQFNF